MATHSSILAQKIPWTEDPVHRLQSLGYDVVTKQQQLLPSFLLGHLAFLLKQNTFICPIYAVRKGGGGLVDKSCPTLATPWTVVQQAPHSMGFPRQEFWSGLPFPSSAVRNSYLTLVTIQYSCTKPHPLVNHFTLMREPCLIHLWTSTSHMTSGSMSCFRKTRGGTYKNSLLKMILNGVIQFSSIQCLVIQCLP